MTTAAHQMTSFTRQYGMYTASNGADVLSFEWLSVNIFKDDDGWTTRWFIGGLDRQRRR